MGSITLWGESLRCECHVAVQYLKVVENGRLRPRPAETAVNLCKPVDQPERGCDYNNLSGKL